MSAALSALPEIIVSDLDAKRLLSLLDTEVAARHPQAAEVLETELERAKVVPHDQVPHDVVRMGSRVLYVDSFGARAEIELVYPWDATSSGRVSVLSPLGASLLGLREGASFDWRSPSGRVQRVGVLSVTPGPARPSSPRSSS